MVELGGFFAVSYVAEQVFTEALENAWKLWWSDARGAISYSVATPYGELIASGAFSLEKPAVALVGAANAARLSLSAALRLDLQLDGVSVGGAFLEATANVDVPIIVVQEGAWKKATVDLSQFVLTRQQLRLTWFDGPFDARASDAVLSDASRARLTDELRRRARPYLEFSLPTDLVYTAEVGALTAGGPGSIIYVPQTTLGGVRVLDGWLAIGVDDAFYTQTHGNLEMIGAPPPLAPYARDITVILVVDSALAQKYLNVNAKFALVQGLGSRPNIHPVGEPGVLLRNNAVEITSYGRVDAPDPFPGSMPYSATITVKPLRGSSGWVYASVSPNIRVDADWFLEVLGDIADFFGADVYARLRRANQGSSANLFPSGFGGQVPGMPGMGASISVEAMVLEPDLLAFYFRGTTSCSAASPPNELQLILEPSSVKIRERFIQLGWREMWAPLLLADPTYRLRYQIRRGSNGSIVAQGTAWSGTPRFGEAVDLWDPANYLETSFSADVVVERPPGNELQRSTHEHISVDDLFDRAHPFARWHRNHRYVDRGIHPPENATLVRKSAIHKTAIRERCKFSDAGTGSRPYEYTVQALDTLPPPEEEENEEEDFSSRLCPYCFRAH